MIEKLLGLGSGFTLTDLGFIAAITTVVVEVLKQCVSKKFPTQILTLIVSLLFSLGISIACYGIVLEAILIAILMGFISAYVSMKGFDSLKEIFNRYLTYNYDKNQVDKENGNRPLG